MQGEGSHGEQHKEVQGEGSHGEQHKEVKGEGSHGEQHKEVQGELHVHVSTPLMHPCVSAALLLFG